MSDKELAIAVDFLKGCYRILHEIRDIVRDGKRSLAPTQAALPLDEDEGLPEPGGIARAIAAAPRKWGNAVKVYEFLAKFAGSFTLLDMMHNADEIGKATGGKVGIASYQRILSALVRAGAATRKGGVYTLRPPTDELRAAVEEARKGRRTA